MLKYFCEITLKCDDSKIRVYKSCGLSQEDAENKLLSNFPGCEIIKSVVLHTYSESDYGWC